ncbi:MAG TPA: class I SAM-dependent methyltransferase, partial [Pyrinomonadaceae bacterium]|nr:class I SAM-dependent methyltransferase [Pyrinomonadaceae bacterium]
SAQSELSPLLFFETINAYQRSEALKAAIELDLFTAIAEGNETTAALAERCSASERGTRVLCDYLTILGFLSKQDSSYKLTPDSAAFLNRHSPAYMGSAVEFLLSPMLMQGFSETAAAVRKGGTVVGSTVAPDNPIWVKFARGMAGLMMPAAQMMAGLLDPEHDEPLRVLDIAAGHGRFGITLAERNPQTEVTALDWAAVLEVAKENAAQAGVSERYHTIAGSAFEVDFGTGYDIVLLTNFLHHFDPPTNETLLRKVRAALKDGGRVATLEFVPNADRISPPPAAMFSFVMLVGTPAGDAYTFSELERMFANAGFARSELHPLPPTPESLVISYK